MATIPFNQVLLPLFRVERMGLQLDRAIAPASSDHFGLFEKKCPDALAATLGDHKYLVEFQRLGQRREIKREQSDLLRTLGRHEQLCVCSLHFRIRPFAQLRVLDISRFNSSEPCRDNILHGSDLHSDMALTRKCAGACRVQRRVRWRSAHWHLRAAHRNVEPLVLKEHADSIERGCRRVANDYLADCIRHVGE